MLMQQILPKYLHCILRILLYSIRTLNQSNNQRKSNVINYTTNVVLLIHVHRFQKTKVLLTWRALLSSDFRLPDLSDYKLKSERMHLDLEIFWLNSVEHTYLNTVNLILRFSFYFSYFRKRWSKCFAREIFILRKVDTRWIPYNTTIVQCKTIMKLGVQLLLSREGSLNIEN